MLAVTYGIDQLVGDPEWFPHPVRIIGMLSTWGEAALRSPEDSNVTQLLTGALLTISIVTTTFFSTREVIRWAGRPSRVAGLAIEAMLGWTCIAAHNLQEEASEVHAALAAYSIAGARQRLSRIVGRDTEALDATDINRALIETLAESTSDGVIAPIFYMALGGVPLAMTYKAINTLDSMIGHADERYWYFGKVAARLDDLANYLPARLTALLITGTAWCLQGYDGSRAARTWMRDAHKHKSPNAGQPESAIAGALGVRLGGTNSYNGEVLHSEIMGSDFPPPDDLSVQRALRLTAVTSLIGVLTCFIVTGFLYKNHSVTEGE